MLNARMRRQSVLGGKRMSVSKIPPVDRRKLALDRFRRAVMKVKAMIRFGFPLKAPPTVDEEESQRERVSYENTFQLGPQPDKRFRPDRAMRILQDVLKDNLNGYKYSKVTAPKYCRALSAMIVDKMKELGFPRYKYICHVVIGQNQGQGYHFSSRGLWDVDTDNTATASMKCQCCFVVATVHAVYFP